MYLIDYEFGKSSDYNESNLSKEFVWKLENHFMQIKQTKLFNFSEKFMLEQGEQFVISANIRNEIIESFLPKELKTIFDYSKLELNLSAKNEKVIKNKL